MALPKISTLNNVYINGVRNKQWNTNGGTFGLLNPNDFITSTYGANGYGQNFYGGVIPNSALPFVTATRIPSFFGASGLDATNSSISAKVAPATGGATIQTALIIKQDDKNYVEMYYGPDGTFGAYSATNNVPRVPAQAFPPYSQAAHAYWRIRNDSFLFYFDVSPDGNTWTNLGNVSYSWDATNITVMFFAGYTGNETQGNRAFFSQVNQGSTSTVLKGSQLNTSFVHGTVKVTNPNALSGKVSGFSMRQNKAGINIGIAQGGLTDFTIADFARGDPAATRGVAYVPANIQGGGSVNWQRSYNAFVPNSVYRDGSYWKPTNYTMLHVGADSLNDTEKNIFTNVQMEKAAGTFNRLSPEVAYYINSCEFVAQKSLSSTGQTGSTFVTRSKDIALAGNYSGKMVFGGTPVADGGSRQCYWPYPTRKALTPVIQNAAGQEIIRGSVSLSTTRAGTQWYPALAMYDSNFNLLNNSTFISVSVVPNITTHPGGGQWQTASVVMPTGITACRYISVVPVVIVPGTTPETVYMAGHTITGITPNIAAFPSTYVDPQQITISLKADRINYAMNSGFPNNIQGWVQAQGNVSGSPNPLTMSWDGTTGFNSVGSLKAAYAAPSGTWTTNSNGLLGPASILVSTAQTVTPIIQGLKVGHTYTFSAWIKQGPKCPDVSMTIIDPNYNGLYFVSLNNIKNTDPTANVNGWTRLYATFTIPPDGGSDYRLWFTVNGPDIVALAPFNFWIDSIMVEEANSPGPYFDGSFASPEFQYEMQSTSEFNKSYYYKDFTNKLARVKAIVPQYAPLASNIQILSAQPIP